MYKETSRKNSLVSILCSFLFLKVDFLYRMMGCVSTVSILYYGDSNSAREMSMKFSLSAPAFQAPQSPIFASSISAPLDFLLQSECK